MARYPDYLSTPVLDRRIKTLTRRLDAGSTRLEERERREAARFEITPVGVAYLNFAAVGGIE